MSIHMQVHTLGIENTLTTIPSVIDKVVHAVHDNGLASASAHASFQSGSESKAVQDNIISTGNTYPHTGADASTETGNVPSDINSFSDTPISHTDAHNPAITNARSTQDIIPPVIGTAVQDSSINIQEHIATDTNAQAGQVYTGSSSHTRVDKMDSQLDAVGHTNTNQGLTHADTPADKITNGQTGHMDFSANVHSKHTETNVPTSDNNPGHITRPNTIEDSSIFTRHPKTGVLPQPGVENDRFNTETDMKTSDTFTGRSANINPDLHTEQAQNGLPPGVFVLGPEHPWDTNVINADANAEHIDAGMPTVIDSLFHGNLPPMLDTGFPAPQIDTQLPAGLDIKETTKNSKNNNEGSYTLTESHNAIGKGLSINDIRQNKKKVSVTSNFQPTLETHTDATQTDGSFDHHYERFTKAEHSLTARNLNNKSSDISTTNSFQLVDPSDNKIEINGTTQHSTISYNTSSTHYSSHGMRKNNSITNEKQHLQNRPPYLNVHNDTVWNDPATPNENGWPNLDYPIISDMSSVTKTHKWLFPTPSSIPHLQKLEPFGPPHSLHEQPPSFYTEAAGSLNKRTEGRNVKEKFPKRLDNDNIVSKSDALVNRNDTRDYLDKPNTNSLVDDSVIIWSPSHSNKVDIPLVSPTSTSTEHLQTSEGNVLSDISSGIGDVPQSRHSPNILDQDTNVQSNINDRSGIPNFSADTRGIGFHASSNSNRLLQTENARSKSNTITSNNTQKPQATKRQSQHEMNSRKSKKEDYENQLSKTSVNTNTIDHSIDSHMPDNFGFIGDIPQELQMNENNPAGELRGPLVNGLPRHTNLDGPGQISSISSRPDEVLNVQSQSNSEEIKTPDTNWKLNSNSLEKKETNERQSDKNIISTETRSQTNGLKKDNVINSNSNFPTDISSSTADGIFSNNGNVEDNSNVDSHDSYMMTEGHISKSTENVSHASETQTQQQSHRNKEEPTNVVSDMDTLRSDISAQKETPSSLPTLFKEALSGKTEQMPENHIKRNDILDEKSISSSVAAVGSRATILKSVISGKDSKLSLSSNKQVDSKIENIFQHGQDGTSSTQINDGMQPVLQGRSFHSSETNKIMHDVGSETSNGDKRSEDLAQQNNDVQQRHSERDTTQTRRTEPIVQGSSFQETVRSNEMKHSLDSDKSNSEKLSDHNTKIVQNKNVNTETNLKGSSIHKGARRNEIQHAVQTDKSNKQYSVLKQGQERQQQGQPLPTNNVNPSQTRNVGTKPVVPGNPFRETEISTEIKRVVQSDKSNQRNAITHGQPLQDNNIETSRSINGDMKPVVQGGSLHLFNKKTDTGTVDQANDPRIPNNGQQSMSPPTNANALVDNVSQNVATSKQQSNMAITSTATGSNTNSIDKQSKGPFMFRIGDKKSGPVIHVKNKSDLRKFFLLLKKMSAEDRKRLLKSMRNNKINKIVLSKDTQTTVKNEQNKLLPTTDDKANSLAETQKRNNKNKTVPTGSTPKTGRKGLRLLRPRALKMLLRLAKTEKGRRLLRAFQEKLRNANKNKKRRTAEKRMEKSRTVEKRISGSSSSPAAEVRIPQVKVSKKSPATSKDKANVEKDTNKPNSTNSASNNTSDIDSLKNRTASLKADINNYKRLIGKFKLVEAALKIRLRDPAFRTKHRTKSTQLVLALKLLERRRKSLKTQVEFLERQLKIIGRPPRISEPVVITVGNKRTVLLPSNFNNSHQPLVSHTSKR